MTIQMKEVTQSTDASMGIDAVLDSMIDAWNRGDLQTYTSFWTEDADLVNVVGQHRHGRSQILAELKFLHATRFRGTQIRNLGHAVRMLSPEIAVVRLSWEMRGDAGMPGHPVENGTRRGVFTHVMQCRPEGWRLISSQNTDVLPIPDFLQQAV